MIDVTTCTPQQVQKTSVQTLRNTATEIVRKAEELIFRLHTLYDYKEFDRLLVHVTQGKVLTARDAMAGVVANLNALEIGSSAETED